ncbi:hypothetical protein [Viridibacillus sp. FSL H8-0110]|uniref:hypothetical protein n=1 Tax=Viridibacillus sp. FSL H8-0110 TaxID=2921376 RepID=UPI0030F586E6
MDNLQKLSKQMIEIGKKGKWAERNEVAVEYRKLFEAHDFGLKVGQVMEFLDGVRWKQGVIKKIVSNWEIHFSDIIVSASLIRPEIEQYEQTTLF